MRRPERPCRHQPRIRRQRPGPRLLHARDRVRPAARHWQDPGKNARDRKRHHDRSRDQPWPLVPRSSTTSRPATSPRLVPRKLVPRKLVPRRLVPRKLVPRRLDPRNVPGVLLKSPGDPDPRSPKARLPVAGPVEGPTAATLGHPERARPRRGPIASERESVSKSSSCAHIPKMTPISLDHRPGWTDPDMPERTVGSAVICPYPPRSTPDVPFGASSPRRRGICAREGETTRCWR